MNKIYEILFGQFTPSLQLVMKGVTDYKKKSKDCDCLWLMEDRKKITAGLDIKEKPRLSIIEQIISFSTMRQDPAETNGECLNMFNYQL